MRNRFVEHLVNKAHEGQLEKTFILTGDLGFSVLEPLQKLLKDRFVNVGINESLMASAAAGISSEGYKVFIYSIAPFTTFRCLEQIRNDICYHNVDVTVVGIGAGYGYGSLGPTHHAVEDLAALWALPNMKVFSPADIVQSDWCFEKNFHSAGPSYLRLGKGREGELCSKEQMINDGIWEIGEGSDFTIITTGHILEEGLKLSSLLKNKGLSPQVLSVAVLKPFPVETLTSAIKSKKIIVLEEMSPYGSFSSHVAKVILSKGMKIDVFRAFSTQDQFAKVVGSAKFQRKQQMLDAESIFNRIINI